MKNSTALIKKLESDNSKFVTIHFQDGKVNGDNLPVKTKKLCKAWAEKEFGFLPKFQNIPKGVLLNFLDDEN